MLCKKFKKKTSNPDLQHLIHALLEAHPSKEPIIFDQSTNKIVHEIMNKTKEWNTNNISRTKAYLTFYQSHTEIHWAFLAHMVSRNGGYNMTDLKGEFLQAILSEEEQEAFFQFIERGNWLIFQDAFPQLLLYHYSIKHEKNYFHLLRYFGVSRFMEVAWNVYWKTKKSELLTVCMIINEQFYIEKRIIQNKSYQQNVLQTLEFTLQDLLSMNQLLFPYTTVNHRTTLVGRTLHHFSSIKHRILFGVSLYKILFSPLFQQSINTWAMNHQHTGSRSDYWPHIFHTVRTYTPASMPKNRLEQCVLLPGAERIYSPTLRNAWKNVHHHPPKQEDWYEDWNDIELYFCNELFDDNCFMSERHCKTLERLELAAYTSSFLK